MESFFLRCTRALVPLGAAVMCAKARGGYGSGGGRDRALVDLLFVGGEMALPPISKVLKARIDRAKRLWIEAAMPRPRDGSFAAEVWQAAKSGIVKAFSLGASWVRSHAKGYQEVMAVTSARSAYVSIGVNGLTLADAITPTTAKCINGVWLPDSFAAQWGAALLAHRVTDLERDVAMAELELSVAELLL